MPGPYRIASLGLSVEDFTLPLSVQHHLDKLYAHRALGAHGGSRVAVGNKELRRVAQSCAAAFNSKADAAEDARLVNNKRTAEELVAGNISVEEARSRQIKERVKRAGGKFGHAWANRFKKQWAWSDKAVNTSGIYLPYNSALMQRARKDDEDQLVFEKLNRKLRLNYDQQCHQLYRQRKTKAHKSSCMSGKRFKRTVSKKWRDVDWKLGTTPSEKPFTVDGNHKEVLKGRDRLAQADDCRADPIKDYPCMYRIASLATSNDSAKSRLFESY